MHHTRPLEHFNSSNNSNPQPQTARLRVRASKIGVHVNIPFPRRIVELEFGSPFLVVEDPEDGGEDEVEFLVGEIYPVTEEGGLAIIFQEWKRRVNLYIS